MLKRILLIAAITVWNSVDDLKQFVFKIRFDRGKRQLGLIAFSIVYAGIVLIYANYYGDSELHPPDISVVSINPDKIFSAIELFFAELPYLTTSSIITGIGIFIMIVITTVPSIFRWLGRSKSQLGYMSRLFLIFILCGMPILFIAFGQPGINRLIRGYSHQTQLFIVIPAQLSLSLPLFLVYINISSVATFTMCIIIACYFAQLTTFLLEILTRRIAEYPRGTILAISALVGAIASIAKAFH